MRCCVCANNYYFDKVKKVTNGGQSSVTKVICRVIIIDIIIMFCEND